MSGCTCIHEYVCVHELVQCILHYNIISYHYYIISTNVCGDGCILLWYIQIWIVR